jgi:glutathione S-transferase
MAAHIVLEESGEEYEAKKVDLAGGEQRTEAYLKINPLGRVPALLFRGTVHQIPEMTKHSRSVT